MANWGTIYNTTLSALRQHSETMARLQEQGSSGARIVRPSDDPADAHKILRLRGQQQTLETYTANLDEVFNGFKVTDSILRHISDRLTDAKVELTNAANATGGPTVRRAAATAIDSILEEVLSLANTASLGRYILGGSDTDSAPFEAERSNGKIRSVRYVGSDEDLPVPVAPGVDCSAMLVGGDLFYDAERGDPEFLGRTGAAPGQTTSSARGDVYLVVSHQQTNYQAGTGLAAGASSAGLDTIVGSHTLTVDAAARTVSLDGGPAVSFTNEADLKVTNHDGDVAYVDMSGWAGYDGDVAADADAWLSIDDSIAPVSVTSFTDDIAVADADGKVLYVDATGITRVGVEPVRIAGTHDLFGTLINIRDLLDNTRLMTDQEQADLLNEALGSLDEVSAVLTRGQTALGGRFQAMDSLKESVTAIHDRASDEADELEQADIAQVATELARVQVLYEMTLAISAKLMSTSLLDYI